MWTCNGRRALVAVCVSVIAAVSVPAGPAWAHSTLLHTDPAKGSTVTTPVATITLTFDEMVRQSKTVVTVTGPDGVSYSDGPARVVDKNVLQAVRPLPAGAITVTWVSAAPDGDAISGTFAFTSAAPSPAASPSPSPPVPASPSPAAAVTSAPAPAVTSAAPVPASDDSGSGSALWWVIGVLALALLGGGGWWWSRRGNTG